MAAAQDEAWPDDWPPLPRAAPEPLTLTCPCPARGLRCGDCMMIAFAAPPFTATPLGWTLATGRRFGWWIRDWIIGEPDED